MRCDACHSGIQKLPGCIWEPVRLWRKEAGEVYVP